jgi:antibiotic biosynthesis monooxygenase (ABM) superfamily enzyme
MNDPPVTINIIKPVKQGCESDFESVLADWIAAAEGFDGHLGANVFHSGSKYRIVFKCIADIANRLNKANHRLEMLLAIDNDSY